MKSGKTIKGALNYNERKVSEGAAELIAAYGFPCDIESLNFSAKLKRFEELIHNSSKVSYNTLHISLNFAPGENLDTETLQEIAKDYMRRIGFANQPFLAYRHDDTAHPHIHIVTTPIKQNGKSINIHHLAKRKSEPARKSIEKEFGLVKAEERKRTNALPLQPIPLKAAWYGHEETKRAISNIVLEVVARYRFSSLDELNAVLRQFNVTADRGSVNSRMYHNRGLVYSIIDKDGYKTGVPIKASSIYTSPTLSTLEKKFDKNQARKPLYQKATLTKVNAALLKSATREMFTEKLKEKNIGCSVRYSEAGAIKAISFVDHANKTVFTCEELGFTIESLLKRINHPRVIETTDHAQDNSKPSSDYFDSDINRTSTSFDLIKTLLSTQAHQPDLSPEFLKRKRKKRKR